MCIYIYRYILHIYIYGTYIYIYTYLLVIAIVYEVNQPIGVICCGFPQLTISVKRCRVFRAARPRWEARVQGTLGG